MDRKEMLFKNLRITFLIIVAFLMTIEILIPAFGDDITDIFISQPKSRDSFKTDLYVSSIYTQIICTVGLFGNFKNSYRVIRIFNLFEGINCIFSLYITIRVFYLSLLTVLNLTLLYVGCKYERYLKQDIHRVSDIRRVNRRNHMEITAISRNSLQTTSCYPDPSPPYEAPPPYSEELTQIPKIELTTSSL